jgi:hypothetical protein
MLCARSHQAGRMRSLRSLVVCGGAFAVLMAGPAQVPAGARVASASTPTPPPIDLTNPTAIVNDPIAGLAPVDTECHAGQVDLNQASITDISVKLNIASIPTVRRLVAMRPWLKGSDLSSVPGIGPPTAKAIAPKTCATQPTLPPSTPRVCTSSSQVDLQAASPALIASKLKLPRVTAQAIVAARPLPQYLNQVVTPRVPGLSRPKLGKLLQRNQVCVTPAPILAGGSAWRWATANGGTVVTRAGFSLIVPPGRVTQPYGAYASVTPLPASEGVLPQMDGRIWGAWASGTTDVAVQGPWNAADPAASPVVLHDSSDRGTTLSTGDGVALSVVDGNPTVTALEYSLSVTTFGASSCNPSGDGTTPASPTCIKDIVDGSLHDEWIAQATTYATGAAATITERPSCETITGPISVVASLGKLPFGVSCVTNEPDSTGGASWDMTNNASGSVFRGLATLGGLYHYSVHEGISNSYVAGGSEDDFALSLIEKALTNEVPYLFPDQTLHVSKPINSGDTNVDMTASAGVTGAWAGMSDIVDTVGGHVFKLWHDLAPADAEATLSECAHLDSSGVACLRDAAGRAVDAVLARPDLLSLSQQMFYATAKRALVLLSVGDWLTQFGFSFAVSFGDGQGVLLRDNSLPPNGGGGGIGPDDSYIARDPISSSHRSVLVKPDGTVLNIADGGTFDCLAATWAVWDNPSLAALNTQPTGNATCGDAGSRVWDFTPVVKGGNVPDNVLLRERPQDATHGIIASWLINSSGAIQTIPDGGTYLCLAYANATVWNVPFTKVQAWRPVGTSDASCGATAARPHS